MINELKAWTVLILLPASLLAARDPGHPSASRQSSGGLKETGPGLFELDGVRLNKRLRTVEFPATVNMREGTVEYLIVHAKGKVHESVLKTDVDPYKIHLATLLLGVNATNPAPTTGFIQGVATRVEIVATNGSWKGRGEDLIFNKATQQTMKRTSWVYNGSRTERAAFQAQVEGSIIAMVDDELALMNNPLPGRENDEIWQVNTNALQQGLTGVTVILHFEDGVITAPRAATSPTRRGRPAPVKEP